MNQTQTAATNHEPAPAPCAKMTGEWLAELKRIYVEAGLPSTAALEAALADSLFFDLCRPCQG